MKRVTEKWKLKRIDSTDIGRTIPTALTLIFTKSKDDNTNIPT